MHSRKPLREDSYEKSKGEIILVFPKSGSVPPNLRLFETPVPSGSRPIMKIPADCCIVSAATHSWVGQDETLRLPRLSWLSQPWSVHLVLPYKKAPCLEFCFLTSLCSGIYCRQWGFDSDWGTVFLWHYLSANKNGWWSQSWYLGLGLGAKIVQLLITVFSHIFAC